ncbi:hypothetical protein JX265_009085 [Neoarthrinium moseri]|uniref:P-loop containing nucleoside triphosphate hydrolase protein n=1 Tax=Neoarthrinium moseri TaxID=1658444 RepID=A0A9P9WH81_9PEZI|nr:hypothetical protein JX266_007184 [Neoarthrinium moseri]KAI1863039.1 hypothetical protein JX265_009085 [Neoarthrinium moseri]
MSRVIDSLPTPSAPREKKLIVTANSRTGTFSLYQALKIMGYKPYHMYEVVQGGVTHMKILEEGLNAKYHGIGKPYGKAEFEKWFADYDVIIEVTPLFLEEIFECYPDAKYMHVERDVDSWYRSVDNTGGQVFEACGKFPLTQMRLIDDFVDKFCSLHLALAKYWTGGRPWREGKVSCVQRYLETNRLVRDLIPTKNLAIFKLEDGFGWEQICPFLGKPMPDVPYPRGNAPAEFQKMASEALSPAFRRAALFVATSALVPLVAIGLWYCRSRK